MGEEVRWGYGVQLARPERLKFNNLIPEAAPNVQGSNTDSLMNAASHLLHAPLVTGSGEVLGRVQDMVINRSSGKVLFLVIDSLLDSLVVDPAQKEGALSVRLDWRDVKVDAGGEQLILVPGRTPVKRLLMRAAGVDRKAHAVH